MIQDTIRKQLPEAMKARETLRVEVLRGISAAFVNEQVTKGKKPDEPIADEDALTVVKRLVKQRRDSIEQFRKGNREDLATKEESEMKILEAYLPATLSRDAIKPVAEALKAKLGVTDKTKSGILVGAVMKELKGSADGGDVKAVVDSLFA